MFSDVDKKTHEIGVGGRIVAVVCGRPVTDAVIGSVKLTVDNVRYEKFVILNNDVQADAKIVLDEPVNLRGYKYFYFIDVSVTQLFKPVSEMHYLSIGDKVRYTDAKSQDDFVVVASWFNSEDPMYCLRALTVIQKDDECTLFLFPASRLISEGFKKLTDRLIVAHKDNNSLINEMIRAESTKHKEERILFIKNLQNGVVRSSKDGLLHVDGEKVVFPNDAEIAAIKKKLKLK